jgi:hypothetical protein
MKAQAVAVGLKGQYKLPEDFSREIGRIVVHWAYYEHYLTRLIWKLLSVTPTKGRLAVREPRTDERLELISELAALNKLALDQSLVNSMIVRTKQLRTQRDLMAHGGWAYYEPDQSWNVHITRGNWPTQTSVQDAQRGKRSITPEFTPITVDWLKTRVDEIEMLIRDAKKLVAVIAPEDMLPK